MESKATNFRKEYDWPQVRRSRESLANSRPERMHHDLEIIPNKWIQSLNWFPSVAFPFLVCWTRIPSIPWEWFKNQERVIREWGATLQVQVETLRWRSNLQYMAFAVVHERYSKIRLSYSVRVLLSRFIANLAFIGISLSRSDESYCNRRSTAANLNEIAASK